MWKKNIFLHKIAYKIALCFLCVSMVLTFNVRRSKAFAITGTSMLVCWAVGTVIALATGYQLSNNDAVKEHAEELATMYQDFYSQLLTKFGNDVAKNLFNGEQAVADVAGGIVHTLQTAPRISLSWINAHIQELKPLANEWLNKIKSLFASDSSSLQTLNDNELFKKLNVGSLQGIYVSDFNENAFKNFYAYVITSSGASVPWSAGGSPEGLYKKRADTYNSCYHKLYNSKSVFSLIWIYITDENVAYDSYCEFKGIDEDIYNKLINGIYYLYLDGFVKDNDRYDTFKYSVLDSSYNILKTYTIKSNDYSDKHLHYGLFILPGVKVLSNDKAKLLDVVKNNDTLELDNVKNYTDRLNDTTLDGVGYVSPGTLSIDLTDTKNPTVANPGTLDFPYALPSDWTSDVTKPYTGTDGKTHDDVYNPAKPIADTDDLPIAIPLPNDTVFPNDLPYDDVIDAVKDDPANPALDPDVKTPEYVPSDTEPSNTYRDWHKIFPFCIPWDYAKIVNFFRADKKAPSFEFDLGNVISSGNKSKTLKVDLSEYEEQGKWLRNLELILFAVGLLLITRYIIKG